MTIVVVIGVGVNHTINNQESIINRGLPLPYTPPLWVLYFHNMLLLGVGVGVCYYWTLGVGSCYYWGWGAVFGSSGDPCIIFLVVGGYLFF